MADRPTQDRTEKATPKRRQDARKKGRVAQSREIPSVMILLMSLGVFFFGGSWMFWNLSGFLSDSLRSAALFKLVDVDSAGIFLIDTFQIIFKILLPLMIVVFVAGLAGNVAQFGFKDHANKQRRHDGNNQAGSKFFAQWRAAANQPPGIKAVP